jgi:hypothetical protein
MAKPHAVVDLDQPGSLSRLENRASDPENDGRSPEKRWISQRLRRRHQ